jgi:hypothetical protein
MEPPRLDHREPSIFADGTAVRHIDDITHQPKEPYATPHPTPARLRDGGLVRTDVRLDRQRVVVLPVHPNLICIEFRPTTLKLHRNISKEQVS